MDTTGLLKGLPPMELEFNLELKGNKTGKMYSGTFKYQIPNVLKNSQIAISEARLNGGMAEQLDASTALLHYMLAYLRHTIDLESAPKWWTESDFGANLYDPNVITGIYQKCMEFEKDWEKKVHGSQEDKKD